MTIQLKLGMERLAEVEVDREGKFKYILVKVWPADGKEGDNDQLIVRGTAEAEFHPDIFAKVKTPFCRLNKMRELY